MVKMARQDFLTESVSGQIAAIAGDCANAGRSLAGAVAQYRYAAAVMPTRPNAVNGKRATLSAPFADSKALFFSRIGRLIAVRSCCAKAG